MNVGEIATDATGIGHLEAKLTGLTRYDYNQFLVAARTASDAAGELPATSVDRGQLFGDR